MDSKIIENVFWGILFAWLTYQFIVTVIEEKSFLKIWNDKLQFIFEWVSFVDKAAVYKSMYAIINGHSIYENIIKGEKCVQIYRYKAQKKVLIKTINCPGSCTYSEKAFKIKDYEGMAKCIMESGIFNAPKPLS